MKIEFIVVVNNKNYEISELVTKISYTDKLNDGCSKLEFSYINKDLLVENGSIIQFRFNNTNIFRGYVFKVKQGSDKEINITAYDQLRYCKAKDTIVVNNDTVTTLTNRMCNYYHLKKAKLTDTKYLLHTSVQDSKTWLDIIYTAISDTLMNTKKKYCIRDEFGKVAIRDIEELKLNLILGDKNLCYDFDYEQSIDDEFYNQIKICVKAKTKRESEFVIKNNPKSISKYGLLQYYEAVDQNSNSSQIKEKAKSLLSLYNRQTETLSMECLGDTSIRAGSCFYAYISDIRLDKMLIVKEVTHKFLPNHTMSLEVMI